MYADSGSALRQEMTALLELHRVRRRFGQPDQMAQHVAAIGHYRANVLAWCASALHHVAPMSFSNLPPRNPNPFESSGTSSATRDLAREIARARAASSAAPALLDQLTAHCDNELVEHWRQAARAAALAERDITEVAPRTITAPQAAAVVSDVAAVTQALVVLDRRYHRVPGWTTLARGATLGWTALAAALDVNLNPPDFTIDAAGWQPRVRSMHGRVPPGLLGVLQAEHNVLAGLAHVPHALRLRFVVDSQRVLSARLGTLARRTEPERIDYWDARARLYAELQRHLRDIGGVRGGGERAATEAANVVARLRAVPSDTIVEPRTLAGFTMLAERIDDRIAAVVEQGITRGDYVQRVTLPRLDVDAGQLVHTPRARYRVVSHPDELPLVHVARQLRAQETHRRQGPDASRVQLHAALTPTSCGDAARAPLQP